MERMDCLVDPGIHLFLHHAFNYRRNIVDRHITAFCPAHGLHFVPATADVP